MRILVDTSILVRTSQPSSIDYTSSVAAITKLKPSGFEVCLVPQIFYEYWVVATRPASVNGLGFSAEQTSLEIAQLTALFDVLRDERTIFEQWQQLVLDYKVLGKNAHDARLVAAMLRHGIKHLLTLNPKDFRRFNAITVMTPADFAAIQ